MENYVKVHLIFIKAFHAAWKLRLTDVCFWKKY